MTLFFQQILDGIVSGSIYALLGLAIVMVHRGSGVANFAQGEMAMFAAFIAWQCNAWGLPWFAAIIVAIVLSFGIGMFIERTMIRRASKGSLLTVIIVTLGLFLLINQGAGYIWTFQVKHFEGIMPDGGLHIGTTVLSWDSILIVVALVICSVLLYVLLQRTKLGLAMRAATSNAESAELVGIKTNRIFMLSWGIAAAFGAVAGVTVAPLLFLEPNMMFGPLLFAFAGVVIGGIDSPLGAVLGGMIVGISENLAGTYISFVGSDLKVAVPLVLIIITLLIRPTGFFGHKEVQRA